MIYRRATSYGAACLAYPFFFYNTIQHLFPEIQRFWGIPLAKSYWYPREPGTLIGHARPAVPKKIHNKRVNNWPQALKYPVKSKAIFVIAQHSVCSSVSCFSCFWEAESNVFCPRSDAPKKTASGLSKPQVSLKTNLETALRRNDSISTAVPLYYVRSK